MSRSARLILGLIGIVGILAASAAFMWWFGEWTHKLVYEDHNDTALVLLFMLIIGGAFAGELIFTGEIRFGKHGKRVWRPKWNRPPIEPPRASRPIVELRPDEYRRERPE
jgi:hypothetical protein